MVRNFLVVIIFIAVAIVLVAGAACQKLEDPCTVSPEVVIATAPGAGTGGSGAEPLTRGVFTPTDLQSPVVMFFSRDAAPDAGALGGFGGVVPTPSVVIPTGVTVIVLDDARRAEARRESFAVPKRLAERKGSTSAVGVTWAPGRALYHWVETTTTTEPDGRLKTAVQLFLQSLDAKGVEGPLVTPPEMKCEDCRIDVDAIDVRGVRLVTFAISPAPGTGSPPITPTAPTFGAFALGDAGEVLPRALPSIGQPRALPKLDVIDGVLVFAGGGLVPVDTDLRVVGPVLPLPGILSTAFSLDGDPILAWASLGLGSSEAGAAIGGASGEPDLLVQRFDREGRPVTWPSRIATSARVEAIARNGDRIGVVHRGTSAWFALARFSGEKIGGDIALGGVETAEVRLFGERDGNFSLVSVQGNTVVRREITCAP